MISVSQALDHLFALAPDLPTEWVPLAHANGRVLSQDVASQRDQPPFDASAMDGYAVATIQPDYTVVGESAAGHGYQGPVKDRNAVRIFTGAPVPQGTMQIILQEDVTRTGDRITLSDPPDAARYIRPAGDDFKRGTKMSAPRRLGPNDIALLAAMNISTVPVTRKPIVALISTGDELVMPGETPGQDQIIASNTFGLQALLADLGATARILPLARDTRASLTATFDLARHADLIVTIGGASVGDHDLVAAVAQECGMNQAFHKVAMRPGKPLMSGQMEGTMMLGLPGNPVSAMVCGHVFMAPVIRAMLGLGAAAAPRQTARLTAALPANGPREHYMRASCDSAGNLSVFDRQDSALLSVLGKANALAIRPPNDPARHPGDRLEILTL